MAELVDLEAKQQWNVVVYHTIRKKKKTTTKRARNQMHIFIAMPARNKREAKNKSFEIYFNLQNELKEYFTQIVNVT